MTGTTISSRRYQAHLIVALVLAMVAFASQAVVPAMAETGDRTLYLYHTHTQETGRFTFKHNGIYDQKVLGELNHFLRDWRNDQQTKMAPALFDLLWAVYQKTGATQPINIVSSYRSPVTNAMLRSRPGSGVAEHSQHMLGHAMDFYIPGVPLTKLRELAFREQVGGVGYYPTSGSPFVHLDVGNVRAWPRMNRPELARIFPDGKTLHLPTDGRPLSESGRAYAMAEWNKCHRVPCNGAVSTPDTGIPQDDGTRLANADSPAALARAETASMIADAQVQTGTAGPTRQDVASLAQDAPVPVSRSGSVGQRAAVTAVAQDLPTSIPFSTVGSAPLTDLEDDEDGENMLAPQPAVMSRTIQTATGHAVPPGRQNAVSAIASLDGSSAPQPRMLMTAYAPETKPDPEAERALQMIIQRETTASPQAATIAPQQPSIAGATLKTASLGNPVGNLVGGLFEGTFNALSTESKPKPTASARNSKPAGKPAPSQHVQGLVARNVRLVAPDLEHVSATMIMPAAVSSNAFGDLYEVDQGPLDGATELGALSTRITRGMDSAFGLSQNRFTVGAPLFAAIN